MKKFLFVLIIIFLFGLGLFISKGVSCFSKNEITLSTPIPTSAPTNFPTKTHRKYKAAAVPHQLVKRVAMDQGFALGFAKFLCGVSYTNCQATTQALNNMVTPDLKQMFATQFFSPAVVQDIYDRKLTMSFKMDADIIPIEVTDSLDKFFVEGVLTTLSDLKRPGEVVQRQPVAMIVGFSHGPKTQEPIDLFQKADPSEETILAARAK